ncbi:DUF5937 family protein [Streptomyces sp. NPDC021212]|uniref:DUF5937 family protein n=1 Tax=Streptomyces sp. NPDC021212 TaxID=3365118 RepID=UPI0037B50E70
MASPEGTRTRLIDFLERCGTAFFAAEWRAVRDRLETAVVRFRTDGRRSGLAEVLAGLSPTAVVSQGGTRVRYDKLAVDEIDIGPRPLFLVPSIHVWPHLTVKDEVSHPVVIQFAAVEGQAHGQLTPAELRARMSALASLGRMELCRHLLGEPITTTPAAGAGRHAGLAHPAAAAGRRARRIGARGQVRVPPAGHRHPAAARAGRAARCPAPKRLAVSGAGISISYTSPATSGSGRSNDSWKRHSARRTASPSAADDVAVDHDQAVVRDLQVSAEVSVGVAQFPFEDRRCRDAGRARRRGARWPSRVTAPRPSSRAGRHTLRTDYPVHSIDAGSFAARIRDRCASRNRSTSGLTFLRS